MSPRSYHIIMVISRFPPTIGGTEIQCRELSRALVKRGHRVTVLTERYDPTLPAQETLDGVTVVRFGTWGRPPLSSILFSIPLWRWLRANPDIDVLHAHMLAAPAIAALWIGRWMNKPVIVKTAGAGSTGDFGTSRRRLYGRFKLWLFKRLLSPPGRPADGRQPSGDRFIACPSAITYNEAESLGLSKDRLRLIPNGVDVNRFAPRPRLEKPQRHTAIYAGRWAPGKGVEQLLTIWEKAPDLNWNLCMLVNPPPDPDQQARLNRLGARIVVQTNVRDPLPYYQTADLAILLSENEGVSNFLLEAMACALPVITPPTTAVASPAESAGWLVTPSDVSGLILLLRSLEKEGAALQTKGAAGRQQMVDRFSTDTVAGQYETLYEEAINVRDLRRR